MEAEQDITDFLRSLTGGSGADLNELFVAVYGRLHNLAHAERRRWSNQPTLNTTALVHEAYLKLADQRRLTLADRGHFFALAARTMRHILINYAERRRAAKRGGGRGEVSLDDVGPIPAGAEDNLLALDEALRRLEQLSERSCRVVECRFFAGLNITETAEALAISPATVKRDWTLASAWLYKELQA
ncbi:MAG TPA: ECF-type sigma factor [Gammaproteobacteria bacterium]|nr:ECF-type sigma factor [Gammaproteobacteria bacterium]